MTPQPLHVKRFFLIALLFAVLLTMLAYQAAAQLSAIAGPEITSYNNSIPMKATGIAAGLQWEHRALTIEALYSQKGGRYGHIVGDSSDNYKLRMDYLQVNVIYNVFRFLSLGGYCGYLMDRVHAQYWADERDISWLATHWDIVHRWDAGAVADLHVRTDPLTIGARYEYGISPVGRYSWAPLFRQHNTTLHIYLTIPLTK